MSPRNAGALVVGFLKDDPRRFEVPVPAHVHPISGLFIPARVVRLTGMSERDVIAGKCISCNADVYVNQSGMSAVIEKDADVCCQHCHDRWPADIDYSL